MHRRKVNNSGFSLVELIVTVAILAIVVLPLLNAFVISARTNAKAKERLRLTSVAENMMEGIKKMTLEEMAYQFDYPSERFNVLAMNDISLDDSGSLPVYELTYGGSSYQKVQTYEQVKKQVEDSGVVISNWESMVNSSVLKKSATNSQFIGQSSGNYYFFAKNVSVGSGNKKYSTLLSVTPSSAKSYNDATLAKLQSIDVATDAIYVDTLSNASVLALFPVEETSPTVDAMGVSHDPVIQIKDIARKISVNIVKDAVSTTVEVVYTFSATDSTGTILNYNISNVVFDNTDTPDMDLEHIYLMYYPWYTGASDTIYVNNLNDVDCTLHIVKQIKPVGTDPITAESGTGSLEAYETTYRVSLYVKENGANASGKSHCDIQSNLNQNLASRATVSQLWQCQYNLNAASDVYTNVLQGRPLTTPTTKWDRIFDVTVAIYDNEVDVDTLATAEPLATFTGGMTN